jgi:hypothetical protein
LVTNANFFREYKVASEVFSKVKGVNRLEQTKQYEGIKHSKSYIFNLLKEKDTKETVLFLLTDLSAGI